MTQAAWRLVEALSQLLQREERDAVHGDLVESGAGAWRALLDVLGLIARRQAQLWNNWRPWLAAFGVALPCTLLLMEISLSLSRNYQLYAWIFTNYGYIDQRILAETGLRLGPGVWLLICQVLPLLGWS